MRTKIEKKIKEHHKKVRKHSRNTPTSKRGRSKKDLRIPNSAPFKEEMLKDIEKLKLSFLEKKKRNQKISPKGICKESEKISLPTSINDTDKLLDMVASANSRTIDYSKSCAETSNNDDDSKSKIKG